MSTFLEKLFARCEELGASDIHVAVGRKPRLRVQGVLAEDSGFAETSADDASALAAELARTNRPADCADADRLTVATLSSGESIDGAVTSPGGFRYRFNAFRESRGAAVALRRLDSDFLSLEKLGLPAQLSDFCACRDGLVIVTGPTGSGKSTTLATLIDEINRTRDGHIVTIEDPVEYVHESRRCLVNQRQIGRDAASFNSALVESLRQDPDVILVGEIRELETIRTAITAAETGHLVFTTLHSGDCPGAVERLVSVFPAGEQDGVRHQLAMVLRGVLAQHLLPAAQPGERRVPACELMTVTPAVANLVATGRSNQLYSAIETGTAHGMISLDQSLAALYSSGRVTLETALAHSRNPDVLRDRLRRAGGTSR